MSSVGWGLHEPKLAPRTPEHGAAHGQVVLSGMWPVAFTADGASPHLFARFHGIPMGFYTCAGIISQ